MSGEGMVQAAIEFEVIAEPAEAPAYVRPMTALESSCIICFGKGVWGEQSYACQCKADVNPAEIRRMLTLLTVEQMAFLRAFEHTLAKQPVTEEEWPHLMPFYVEDEPPVFDDEWKGEDAVILIPPKLLWFASGQMSMGPGHDGTLRWICYNPNGLALRMALMAGADVV